jgi:hypothetical protein
MTKNQAPKNEIAAAAQFQIPEMPIATPMPGPEDDGFFQGWDSEQRLTELNKLTCSLTGTTLSIHAAFKSALDDQLGIPTAYIMTKTFPTEGKVWIAPCRKRPGAKPLRAASTMGTAEVGFALPLRKLEAKPPALARRFNFEVVRVPVKNGFAFEINFRDLINKARAIDEQALAEQKKAKAEKAKARRTRKPSQDGGAPQS